MNPAPVHLVRGPDRSAANDVLAAATGGRVGLDGVLADLDRTASLRHDVGRPVAWALAWDRADQASRGWWPQGVTSSGDASPDGGAVSGRWLLVTTAYCRDRRGRNLGSRVTVVDLTDPARIRYRHVLLVSVRVEDGRPAVRPVRAHAGGVVWHRGLLHVAATAAGFHTFRLDDVVRVGAGDRMPGTLPGPVDGGSYLLPVAWTERAGTAAGTQPFRYSFLSLSHAPSNGPDGAGPRRLLAGEYGRPDGTRRLLTLALDPATGLLATGDDGCSVPDWYDDRGLPRTQGVVRVGGRLYATTSAGRRPGRLWTGGPGRWEEVAGGLPPGPEDLSYWPARDQLLTLTEHPGRRMVLALDRSRTG